MQDVEAALTALRAQLSHNSRTMPVSAASSAFTHLTGSKLADPARPNCSEEGVNAAYFPYLEKNYFHSSGRCENSSLSLAADSCIASVVSISPASARPMGSFIVLQACEPSGSTSRS